MEIPKEKSVVHTVADIWKTDGVPISVKDLALPVLQLLVHGWIRSWLNTNEASDLFPKNLNT